MQIQSNFKLIWSIVAYRFEIMQMTYDFGTQAVNPFQKVLMT